MSCQLPIRIKKWQLLITAFVCLNLILLGLNYQRLFPASAKFQQQELLPYDSQLDDLPQQMNEYLGDRRLLVVVFIDANDPSTRLRYFDAVYRRQRGMGLALLGVCGATADQADSVKQRFTLSFPVIPDTTTIIHKTLHFSTAHAQEGIVVIDSNRRVKFADLAIPSDDTFRILVEKYLLGSVDYSYHRVSAREFFRINTKAPTVELLDIRNGGEATFGSHSFAGKTLVVYFTDCAHCKLQNYFRSLAHLESSRPDSKNLIAIFASNFATEDLASYALRLEIKSPVYVMRGGGGEATDEYITRFANEKNEPLLVMVDKSGLVSEVVSLDGGAE